MIGLLVASVIIGFIVGGMTGIGILGVIAGGGIFIFGLPFALIGDFVHGEVSYAQDRADYRETLAQIEADERADRIIDAAKPSMTFNDNRQVHLHKETLSREVGL